MSELLVNSQQSMGGCSGTQHDGTVHAMVDIETLGKKPGCVVHEVAVVFFDPSDLAPVDEIHFCIDIDNSKGWGLTVDADTLEWWNEQGGPKQHIEGQQLLRVPQAVASLAAFFERHQPQALWSRGKDFDFPILAHLFAMNEVPAPWKFYQLRCARDLYALAFPGVKRAASSHDALEDCYHQIRDMQEACGRLRLSLVNGHESMVMADETKASTKKLEASSTEAVLAEREQTHGTFHQVAEIAQLLKNVVRDETQALSCQQQEALDMIASKIARICNGNPDEVDHWRDIAGYATLVVKELENGEEGLA